MQLRLNIFNLEIVMLKRTPSQGIQPKHKKQTKIQMIRCLICEGLWIRILRVLFLGLWGRSWGGDHVSGQIIATSQDLTPMVV